VTLVWPELHDAVHRAGVNGELADLKHQLESGTDIGVLADSHWARGTSVLHMAAFTNLDVLDLLLENGAKALLEKRCGPGEEGRWNGMTALQMAVRAGRKQISKRLVAAGANYDVFSAVGLGDLERIQELLADDSDLLASLDEYQSTLLHWAAYCNQVEVINFLLDNGLSLLAKNAFDETPILVALCAKNTVAAKEIFTNEFPIDLFTAAASGDVERVKDLLDAGEDINSRNSHGVTALHFAAWCGYANVAKYLLDHQADVNARDAIGNTPLWYAANWSENDRVTRMLCENNADLSSTNVWGKDVFAYDIGAESAALIKSFQ
jgi:ankyrin repeat protein